MPLPRFNPRPHAAGDIIDGDLACHYLVSIHARTRRATLSTAILRATTSFQSTPARGGRHYRRRSCVPLPRFNPRPHAAGDVDLKITAVDVDVSIHARTRRATMALPKKSLAERFQSTPARGGRRDGTAGSGAARRFNPRPHAAGDQTPAEYTTPRGSFQSTPARGGRRPIRDRTSDESRRFNPRPHAAGDSTLPNLLQHNTLRNSLREPSLDHDLIEY